MSAVTLPAAIFITQAVAGAAPQDSRCDGARDLKLINGRIVTMDKKNSIVSEVTIQNGRVRHGGDGGNARVRPARRSLICGAARWFRD